MKSIKIAFMIFFCSCVSLNVIAHNGRTDSNGGHYNRATGEYHFHHGYPEHQHTDGECPYDFDDQTNHSSGTSESEVTPKPPVVKNNSQPTQTPTSEKSSNSVWIVLLVLLSSPFIIGIVYAIAETISNYIQEKKTKKEANKKEPYIAPQIQIKPLPKNTFLDENLLPYKANRKSGWGYEYNVYITRYGKCYHKKRCKALNDKQAFLIHRYDALDKKYTPCPICKPPIHYDVWYLQLLD